MLQLYTSIPHTAKCINNMHNTRVYVVMRSLHMLSSIGANNLAFLLSWYTTDTLNWTMTKIIRLLSKPKFSKNVLKKTKASGT
jgi:hypothetical protein